MGSWSGDGAGGGPTPPPPEELLFFGQRAVATPGDGGETGFSQTNPTTVHGINMNFIGLVANGFMHIRSPSDFEISAIQQLFLGQLGQNILADWVKTEDYGQINAIDFDSYTRGPINPEVAGQNIEYVVTLVAGA